MDIFRDSFNCFIINVIPVKTGIQDTENKMDSHFRDCVKIEFVISTSGRSLIIRIDFSVEDSFEMTFKEFSHSLSKGEGLLNSLFLLSQRSRFRERGIKSPPRSPRRIILGVRSGLLKKHK